MSRHSRAQSEGKVIEYGGKAQPEKVKPRVVETAAPSTSSGAEPASPATAIASAVLEVLAPPPSAVTQA